MVLNLADSLKEMKALPQFLVFAFAPGVLVRDVQAEQKETVERLVANMPHP